MSKTSHSDDFSRNRPSFNVDIDELLRLKKIRTLLMKFSEYWIEKIDIYNEGHFLKKEDEKLGKSLNFIKKYSHIFILGKIVSSRNERGIQLLVRFYLH